MKSRDLILLALLAGAGYYLLRKNPATGRSLADDLLAGLPFPATGTAGAPSGYYAGTAPASMQPNRGAQYAGLAVTGAGLAIPLLTGGSAAATGVGGTAAGAGAGIGAGAAIAAAGIAAGAAVLAWGILSKGWFRGGDEGIHVNPARDAYAKEYNDRYGLPTIPGNYESQWAGFGMACAAVGMPGYEVDRLRRRINTADHMDEWRAATDDVTRTMQAYADLTTTAVVPTWRQRQLQGETVFASGQTPAQILAEARTMGSDYSDLAAAYAGGF